MVMLPTLVVALAGAQVAEGAVRYAAPDGDAGIQDAPPLLDADLRELPGSPTINAGTPAPIAGLGAYDVDGHPRTVDGTVDIGAAEDPTSSSPPPPAGGGDGAGAPVSAPPSASTAPPVVPEPPPAPPVVERDTTAPRLSRLALSRSRFARPRPARLRVTVDEAATLQVTLRRVRPGRRPGRRPVRVGRALRGAATVAGARVAVRLPRGLRSGRYRARIVARDAAGNRSAPLRIAFVVVPGRGR